MNEIQEAIKKYLVEKGYKKFSLKAVLFDMDGVLYDSMPNHAKSWSQVMQAFGFNMTETEAYMHEGRVGSSTIDIIAKREGRALSLDERKLIYQEKTKIFNSCPEALPMPGSFELLQKVTGKGLFVMLVTGSGQPSLLNRLSNDFPGFFVPKRIVSSFDVKKGKPNPEPYLMALQKGGLQPDEVVVVENAPLGVEAAFKAGLFTVAVNTGPLPDSVLLQSGANLLLPSIKSLCQEWARIYDALKTQTNA